MIKDANSLENLVKANDKYAITSFALPNPLVASKKEGQSVIYKSKSVVTNPELEEFLKRFERKEINVPVPKERRGVNG